MQRGQGTTFLQRLEIAELVAAGQTDREIAIALGCSRWTVRKWRRRARQQNRTALRTHLGRPATGPLSTIDPTLQQTILGWRHTHPGWGADTILATLRADPLWAQRSLPSRARVAAFLKAAGLTHRYQRHTTLPEPSPQVLDTPHQEWELDAQGAARVEGVGTVSLITIIDVISRLKIESYPCQGTTKPALLDYQLALRRAFLTYGLPQCITLDRDTVFFDNTTPSPFPTRMHLWLIALGVAVSFTRPRRPTDHARIERTHQTMTRQALLGQSWPDQSALWQGLDERRAILNTHLPMRVLNGRAPLQAFPTAMHSGRWYYPEWEVDLLQMEHVYDHMAQGRWFRRTNAKGELQLATQRYGIGVRFQHQTIEITFDREQIAFLCRSEDAESTMRVPVKHLDKAYLMGEMTRFMELPTYQLALPFTRTDQRQLEYAHLLADTPPGTIL